MELCMPKPGRYVVAVSGGIDSVCLLDLLVKRGGYELLVAHFDHGIRKASGRDRQFVELLAKQYRLPFYTASGKLGAGASEAAAREARYRFLHGVADVEHADALITAHHRDDRIETLFINLLRGTGRKGLASIGESGIIKRPLLKVSKVELRAYALANGLSWREDETNLNDKYLRNYIRAHVMPGLSEKDRERLCVLMDRQDRLNREIDETLELMLQGEDPSKLRRQTVAILPFNESRELIASWLRKNNLLNFDHIDIERLALGAKTKRPGTRIDVYGGIYMEIDRENLALSMAER